MSPCIVGRVQYILPAASNQLYDTTGPVQQQRGAAAANWQVNAAHADPKQIPAAGGPAAVAKPPFAAAAALVLYADVAPTGESFGFGLDDDLEEEL